MYRGQYEHWRPEIVRTQQCSCTKRDCRRRTIQHLTLLIPNVLNHQEFAAADRGSVCETALTDTQRLRSLACQVWIDIRKKNTCACQCSVVGYGVPGH